MEVDADMFWSTFLCIGRCLMQESASLSEILTFLTSRAKKLPFVRFIPKDDVC
jgi:hypothetical protein